MIPKVIHYCWFGPNPKSELALKCIDSWKAYCSDYRIIEWNEDNFNINCCPYVREAYEEKKWAFVTDYVRLWVLYNYGGIYMDTDVEVLGSLDSFLCHEAFSGFEDGKHIPTAIMGSVVNNSWVRINLEIYNDKHFKLMNGHLDLTTNVETITKLTSSRYKIRLDNTLQDLGDVVIYPRDYFCPKDYLTAKLLYKTANTVTIHHFDGSWKNEEDRQLAYESTKIRNKYGSLCGMLYFNVLQFKLYWKNRGLRAVLCLFIDKAKRKIKM